MNETSTSQPEHYDLEQFSAMLDTLPVVKWPYMGVNKEEWCSKEDLIQQYRYLLETSCYFKGFRSAKGNILSSEGNELQGLEFECPFTHHDGSFSPNRYFIVKVPDEQYAIFWDNPEYDWQHSDLDRVRGGIDFCLRQVLP